MYIDTHELVDERLPRVIVQEVIVCSAIVSCSPEVCNELRILRHVRHPNLVLFHGACIDSETKDQSAANLRTVLRFWISEGLTRAWSYSEGVEFSCPKPTWEYPPTDFVSAWQRCFLSTL